MKRIGAVSLVVGLVIVAYLILLVVMPVLTGIVSTANTTMAATSNMSNYPGTSEGILATPWVLFFAPGVIGMIVIVMLLKAP